jgi:predicted metal-dependent hydrolase
VAADLAGAYNPSESAAASGGEDFFCGGRMGMGTMADDAQAFEQLYVQGIQFFNNCDFFEAHETWEELWTEYRGPARRFYQGLIQAAVALHHFGNGNIRGAKKVYLSSRGYLEEYRPAYLGLDLDAFLAQFERCFAEALASQEEFPRLEVDPELIPEIHLDPALAGRQKS